MFDTERIFSRVIQSVGQHGGVETSVRVCLFYPARMANSPHANNTLHW